MKKPTIEELLVKHNITFYRLTKMMGDHPNNSGKWIRYVRGVTPMPEPLVLKMLYEIGQWSGVDYSIAEVALEPYTYYEAKSYVK